ncbi:MAG: PaaI family thioesterase [Syntrophotalea acetylenica]|jgi:acyl-coenzyme A thioesterase PaaI-like protein|uniref:Thioesterase n=1 Tax=Syntrophotalea acetylenica TaxID=29542 RepID=A0A1L3GJ96_SYNAC|nr:PaaI family thioesterase [Syntrophotalea acetylenica]APG26013.1 thioesterase [Syntrophotalea acetylenica]APG44078.1 thioesterase [Syntrophotalea acetylenica]MDD4457919.1 PaaI family thioesterase [Syntrophotalea acetylenica]
MKARTHLAISSTLVGELVALQEGEAVARLQTTAAMAADEHGLVHGGFTFGLADYAAMLAVNDPHVVLGSADVKFLAPVRCGEVMEATARLENHEGRKHRVHCYVASGEKRVFEGSFICFVLDKPVLG